MEFFGDRERWEEPREVVRELAAALASAAELPEGPLRHGAIAACLRRAGELAQGLADAAERGGGEAAPAEAAMAATVAIATWLWESWRSGGAAPPPGADALADVRARAGVRAGRVRIRRPEGYALYALYPETYAVAAARAFEPRRDVTVIGIRTIGTSLAAAVAAAVGAPRLPVTVRPTGHPFERRLEPTPALLAAVAAGGGGEFAVVDEGPGLSGSSFAAVAQALLDLGVPSARIHLFTSHAHPPGPEASPKVRELFGRLARHAVPFEAAFLAPGPLSIGRLAEDAIGPARVVDDLTGGGWRPRLFGDPAGWPPSEGWLERRKILLAGGGRLCVARFAGLGRDGERKLARARALAEADVGPPPLALRHGFLFERWLEEARPLPVRRAPRAALLEAVRRVVAVTASRPRPASDGAEAWELAAVARINAGEALGPEAAEAARRLEELVPEVARQARPVEVDAKMQAWEWLVLEDGRVVKADGVDHSGAHDLAGCQDALWDVAGAQVELGLTRADAARLAEVARRTGPGADPALLPFYRAAYLALEVGRWTFAAASEPPGSERARRERALARYRRLLGAALGDVPRRPRPREAAARPGASPPAASPGSDPTAWP